MPSIEINGRSVFYESAGSGEPLVLVHGSWTSHAEWAPIVPALLRDFTVITYDRAGHCLSEAPPVAAMTRRTNEDDLVALVERLAGGRAHLLGNSYGASVVLGVAARRPDVAWTVVAHEPPLFALAADHPAIIRLRLELAPILDRLRDGDPDGGARQFFEQIALGPGGFDRLPVSLRAQALSNAGTFGAEQTEPLWDTIDLEALRAFAGRILLTEGDRSPRFYRPAIAALADAVGHAQLVTLAGAGHSPHVSAPAGYAALVRDHLREEIPLAGR
jgi:pimeloyl-ACP methyl ester carboxylesterase